MDRDFLKMNIDLNSSYVDPEEVTEQVQFPGQGISSRNTLDKGKRPMTDVQSAAEGQGGNLFPTGPNYSLQQSVSQVLPSFDLNMLPEPDPFPGQQFSGGVSFSSPMPSVISSSGLARGVSDPLLNSSSSVRGQSTQLTIIYEGIMYTFDDVSPELAEIIMSMAENSDEETEVPVRANVATTTSMAP